MKKYVVSAILAGCAIGFGGTAFLSVENKVLGALFESYHFDCFLHAL